MAEQAIQVICRTAEHYGTATLQCWRELACYFILKGIKHYQYERKKNGQVITIKKPVRGF